MEILSFVLSIILLGVLVAILVWGGVTDWKFSSKMYSCKKDINGKYSCEIDIHGTQSLSECQKTCSFPITISCPGGVRTQCNQNDPQCVNNSVKYCKAQLPPPPPPSPAPTPKPVLTKQIKCNSDNSIKVCNINDASCVQNSPILCPKCFKPSTCEIISNPSENQKCFVGTLKDCKTQSHQNKKHHHDHNGHHKHHHDHNGHHKHQHDHNGHHHK